VAPEVVGPARLAQDESACRRQGRDIHQVGFPKPDSFEKEQIEIVNFPAACLETSA
jgi:hypothetical protein